jgi:hypothetical protein
MAHRVKLVRARVKNHDADLGCDRVRGVGWRLVCSCGQRSPVRARIAELREWEHVRHHQRIG